MRTFIIFLAVLSLSISGFAQNNMSIVGARAAGMGGAGLSNKDSWSLFNNPAGYAGNNKMFLGMYYENKFLMKETSYGAFVFTTPFLSGNMGVSASFFGYHHFSSTKITYGYSKQLSKILSMGANINYYHTRQSEDYGNLNALSFELGVLANPIDKDFTVAAFIGNPLNVSYIENSDIKLPVVLKFGLSYLFYNSLLVSLESGKSINGYTSAFRAGAEYKLHEKFCFRGGFAILPFEYSCGFGYNESVSGYSNLGIDIAFAYHEILGITPKLSVNYEF